MKVKPDTTILKFFGQFKPSNPVEVRIINEETKKVVYEETKSIQEESFYNILVDNQGFNFTDDNTYILEIGETYRATIFCFEQTPKRYTKGKSVNSDEEFIVI